MKNKLSLKILYLIKKLFKTIFIIFKKINQIICQIKYLYLNKLLCQKDF